MLGTPHSGPLQAVPVPSVGIPWSHFLRQRSMQLFWQHESLMPPFLLMICVAFFPSYIPIL